ncbi:MAG: patatin-like phospholipase family protein [Deltaproteobacteria bacterium]|nr:patatin-like phospholipase family protein [Deltaproteobacteria bacterium]
MPRIALVLSGGGARAAYAAGVLRYITREIAPKLAGKVHFDIITGTSAGAINGAFIASLSDDLPRAAEALWEHWEQLTIGQVYRFGARQLWRVPRSILSDSSGHPWGEVALANVNPLRRMLRDKIDWSRLRRCIREGHLDAFSVTATELATSRSIVFLDGAAADAPIMNGKNPFFRPRRARIGPEHVLASSAIPLLFPPVKVGGRHYLDGGLGMNTPLRPALRMGADRVLVLSLRYARTTADGDAMAQQFGGASPTWAQVVGKTMSTVLLDRAAYDVERLQRHNRLIEWGVENYGEEFQPSLDAFMTEQRGLPYRVIRPLLLQPSEDIGRLASEVTMDKRFGAGADEITLRALRFLSGANESGENDAMSYLLFDPVFVHQLLELGERDARDRRDELEAFFAP